MIHKPLSRSLHSAVLKGKIWAKVEPAAFLTRPNGSLLDHGLTIALLEQGIKKEKRAGQSQCRHYPCPDNWFTPWNALDNEALSALLSLAGAQAFLPNALSLSPGF